MSTRDALGPFQAGDGGLPPCLAGREYEQNLCGAFLSRLRRGRPRPREIIFALSFPGTEPTALHRASRLTPLQRVRTCD